MTKPFSILLAMLLIASVSFSQLPAKKKEFAGFRSQWYGGLILHTNGWGVTLTRSKFKTYKKYHEFTFDFTNLKDPKEYKIRYISTGNNEFKRAFKFGKLNSFYTARFSYGRQKLLFEKERYRGVEIFFNWKTGINVGFLKPIYLEIINSDLGRRVINTEERYDPNLHNESNIVGRGPFFKGANETKFKIGGHIKAGFKFELSKKRERIFALETGALIDVFPTGIEILALNPKQVVFYNFYINIVFGKKYYD